MSDMSDMSTTCQDMGSRLLRTRGVRRPGIYCMVPLLLDRRAPPPLLHSCACFLQMDVLPEEDLEERAKALRSELVPMAPTPIAAL